MAHEMITNQNGSLSYVCCRKIDQTDSFKQSYTFHRKAGHNQVFSSTEHGIQFRLSSLNEDSYGCQIKNRLYPVVIVCRSIDTELIK